MIKNEDNFSTSVDLSVDEARAICRMGKGSECCAFLAASSKGFICLRMDYPSNTSIFTRLENGTMNAKGKGGWAGCAWEGFLRNNRL